MLTLHIYFYASEKAVMSEFIIAVTIQTKNYIQTDTQRTCFSEQKIFFFSFFLRAREILRESSHPVVYSPNANKG